MSRFSRFARGVGTTMLTQVLLTVTGLWLTPFLLHHLGGADYGLWLLATQLLAYLTLLDLGVVALLPREVATASGAPDDTGARAAVTQAIARALRILALQLPVIAIASLLLWYYLPTQWLGMRDALGVALAGFVLLYPLRAAMGVLEGLQELPFLGRAFLLAWVVGTVTTVILVASGAGLMAVAAGWIVQQSVASVCWVHRLWSRHRALLPRDMQVDRSETRAQLSRGLWFSLSQVATVLLFGTDLLIIGKVLGPAAVIPYAMTTKLMIVLQNQPQLLMHAALPGIAELRGRANHGDVLRVVFGLALGMLMLSGGVATVILAVNRAFVSWWVGPALFGGQGMTALLLLVMLLRHWGLVLTQANFALGDDRYLGLVSLIEGLVSVTASYTLVHFLGAMGAIAGALIGVVLIRIPMQLAELSRRTGRPRAEIVGTLAPLSWRLALMLVVAAVVARFVPVSAPPVHGRDPFVLAVIAAVSAGLGLAYMALMAGVIRGSPLESYAVRVRGAIVGYWASVRTRLAPR